MLSASKVHNTFEEIVSEMCSLAVQLQPAICRFSLVRGLEAEGNGQLGFIKFVFCLHEKKSVKRAICCVNESCSPTFSWWSFSFRGTGKLASSVEATVHPKSKILWIV